MRQVDLPKPCFQGTNDHPVLFSSYLYTVCLISVLQCFLSLFSQCHATIHPQSASVLNNKSPLHSLCLQDNQMSVSHSRSQPPCHIVFTRSLSLPLSAPCYLWNAEPPKYGEMARRYTLPAAKWCNHCQEIMERPCQRQEAFCHLCHAISPAKYPAFSPNLINTSI